MYTDDSASPYVRRNIWALEAEQMWDPITLALSNAIKVLQTRPLEDPTSWEYLAAAHGRSGPAPAGPVWNECRHGSWFFLPWYRMYLYYFERIVRAEVIQQGGPEDWALPFWDYSNPDHAALPPAFREPTMPDGSANPPFVAERAPGANAGENLPASITSADAALNQTTFIPPPASGFGGGITIPSHFFFAHGELKFTPHNDVHVVLTGAPASADVAVDRRAADERARELGRAAGPEHVYLNLEDIEAERAPAVAYAVYIAGASDSPEEPRYVGNVSFFGIEHYSRTDLNEDGPHGFRRTFDITGRVDELRAESAWDEERVVVSFRPIGMTPPPDAAPEDMERSRAAESRPVTIGRVSIFHG